MRHAQRAVAYSFAISAVLASALVASAQPASADEVVTLKPNVWAYTDSQQPKKTFLNFQGDAPVGAILDSSQKTHIRRSYFTFDLSSVKGTVVHIATLYSNEIEVTDCSAAATVELWRTTPVTSGTTWQKPPTEIELLQRQTRGIPQAMCPGYFGYSAVDLLNRALARHERSVTVELRVGTAEESNARLGRSMAAPRIGVNANHPPTVSGLALVGPDRPCGTPTRSPHANNYTTFTAKVADVDAGPIAQLRFAIWPVDHPDQRREFSGGTGFDGVSRASIDLSGYTNKQLLAWAAQGYDYYDSSPWTRPCYLTIDKDPPKTAPVVVSGVYRPGTESPGYGGIGVPGTFKVDAKGDRDVVGLSYVDPWGVYGYVDLRHPGGRGTFTYTPTVLGQIWIDVTPIDEANNRGPVTRYSFLVRNSAPSIDVDVAGVGLTSHLTLRSSAAGITSFAYQVDGGPETTLPAVDGIGHGDLVFTKVGYPTITARSYIGRKLAGVTTDQVQVSDAPDVTSQEFGFSVDAILGASGSFTFTPRRTNVVAYLYDFGGGQQRIEAAADGTAVLRWVADRAGWPDLRVWSVSADGTVSEQTDYSFYVIDTRPMVYLPGLQNWPRRDGVGVPLDVELSTYLPGVTDFVYRFDGGPEQSIPANGGFNWTTVVPTHAGEVTLVVWSRLADGSLSPSTTVTAQVFNGPVATLLPDADANVVVGKPMTFTLRPGLPGVESYHYSFDGGEELTVAAGADGTAEVTYTPQHSGLLTLTAYSVGVDGTVSDTRTRYFSVLDNAVYVVRVNTGFGTDGGIGVPVTFNFYTQLFSVVAEFEYHINDGPVQTVAMPPESTSAYVTIVPDRNGTNTLYVRSRTTSGEYSPVTEYQFVVGTAPLVESAVYPNRIWAGGVGVTGQFDFSGGTAGIVSFEYQIDFGDTVTVVADAGGRASMTYTPTVWGSHTLTVVGRKADGTVTDQSQYGIYVNYQ